MPKLKSRKAVVKRFKTSATGKLMHRASGLNHLMRKKTKAQRRRLLKGDSLMKGDAKRISKMMGEGH